MARYRFGVTARSLAGSVGLAGCTLLASAIGILSFDRLRDGYDQLAERQMQVLITATKLGQQSEAILKNAAALLQAQTQTERQRTLFEVQDRREWIGKLVEELRREAPDSDSFDAIVAAKELLLANLDQLERLVALRLKIEAEERRTRDRLDSLSATMLRADVPPDAVHRGIALALLVLTENDRTHFSALAEEVARLARELASAPGVAVAGELADLLDGPASVVETHRHLLDVRDRIQATLLSNRDVEKDLTVGVGKLVADLRRELAQRNASFVDLLNTRSGQLHAIMLLCVLGAMGITAYTHRFIVRRLDRVQSAMRSNAHGDAVPIPIEGSDEIADMAWTVQSYVDTIRRNERQILSAKETAEQTLAELRHAQENLIQSEKMASLGQLVAGVAHEINTPLGSAILSTSWLSDRTNQIEQIFQHGKVRRADLAGYIDAVREVTGVLDRNLDRAAQLVSSFKQVAVDQMTEEHRSFLLRAYLEEVVQSLSANLRKAGVQAIVDCPDDIVIEGMPGSLSHIVTNLTINAIVHAFEPGKGGVVCIEATALTEGQLELRFSDDGRGIPPDLQSKIFEPFFTTARARGSTGLGLHIVYNLVTQRLKGRIWMNSVEGRGTTFIIHFPRTQPIAASSPNN